MNDHLNWSQMPVSRLAAPGKWSLNGGPFGSKLVSSMYVVDGVPVIRGANLKLDRRFHDDDFVYVTDEKARELKAHTAVPGDVIFTQRGTLGQVGVIPSDARYPAYVISQSQMKLTVDPNLADAGYIYYCFRAPEIGGSFIAMDSSSGVPHVNLQSLRDFVVPVPPLDIQRRIASILGAYDAAIEVNRQRVAVLEAMARGLFEEWFVRFRLAIGPADPSRGRIRNPVQAERAAGNAVSRPALGSKGQCCLAVRALRMNAVCSARTRRCGRGPKLAARSGRYVKVAAVDEPGVACERLVGDVLPAV